MPAIKFIDRTKYDLFIGIDPGVITGLSIWDKIEGDLITVQSLKITDAIFTVKLLLDFHLIDGYADGTFENYRKVIRIEDARLRKYLPKEKSISEQRGKLQGAGSIKRDCKIWEDFLIDYTVDFELVAPAAGRTKWTEDYFVKLTGWKGRTSNHARDAAALVFGL